MKIIHASLTFTGLLLGFAASADHLGAEEMGIKIPTSLSIEGVQIDVTVKRSDLESRLRFVDESDKIASQSALRPEAARCFLDQLKAIKTFLAVPTNRNAFLTASRPKIKLSFESGANGSGTTAWSSVGNDYFYSFSKPEIDKGTEIEASFNLDKTCRILDEAALAKRVGEAQVRFEQATQRYQKEAAETAAEEEKKRIAEEAARKKIDEQQATLLKEIQALEGSTPTEEPAAHAPASEEETPAN